MAKSKDKQTVTVLKEVAYEVNPFTNITIGDPDYLEAIENKKTTGCEKDLVLKNFKNKDYAYCVLDIKENHIEYEYNGYSGEFNSIEVNIYSCGCFAETDYKKLNDKDREYARGVAKNSIYPVLKSGKYFNVDGIKLKYKTLGCDCAEFGITVQRPDKKFLTSLDFHTGADGQYGDFTDYGIGIGSRITLQFDADLFTFDEITKDFDYLFGIKEKIYEFDKNGKNDIGKEEEEIER